MMKLISLPIYIYILYIYIYCIYIYIYIHIFIQYIVFLKKVFIVLFCSRDTAYIVRDNANTFTSVGLSCKDILFKKNMC